MKEFRYNGNPVNLGRFGHVTKGRILVLCDKEAHNVRGDKAFIPVKAGTAPAIERARAETQEISMATREELLEVGRRMLLDGYAVTFNDRTPTEFLKIAIARAKKQKLSGLNDEQRMLWRELEQKTASDLERFVKNLKDRGRDVDVQDGGTRVDIIKKLVSAAFDHVSV